VERDFSLEKSAINAPKKSKNAEFVADFSKC
jgi:hypothetical protein